MEASLYLAYARDSIDFRWHGVDEVGEIAGEGSAELLDDRTLKIKFS